MNLAKTIDSIWMTITPACLTFGLMFMTNMAGTCPSDASGHRVLYGTFALMLGLMFLFRKVMTQQKTIEQLRAALDNKQAAGAPE